MLRHVVLAGFALAGCTSVATITANVCGNDVLETGEDCDQPTGCTSTCRIACDPTAPTTCSGAFDGTCCPGGMACGADRACHEPTGTVSPDALAFPFDSTAFYVADIDGDLVDDVLGVGGNTTVAFYGDPVTPLARTAVASSPPLAPNATPTFGDITGDGRLDIVVPVVNGLFAFDDASGAPMPINFPAAVDPGITHERIAYIGSIGGGIPIAIAYDHVPAAVSPATTYQLKTIALQTLGTSRFAVVDAQTSLCGISPSTESSAVRGRAIHPYGDALSVRVPLVYNATAVGICVALANPATGNVGDASYAIPKAVFGATYRPSEGDGETFFAPLTSSPCPALVVSMTDGTNPFTMILNGSGIAAHCTVDMLPADAVFLPGKPFAEIALENYVGAGTTPGLITSAGIYTTFTAGSAPAVQPTRAWDYVAVGDLDGDGHQDFVTIGSANDIEVFYQRAPQIILLQLYYSFDRVVVPTQDPVERIALGNFDGDLSGDVAFTTVDQTVTAAPAELFVAWGNLDSAFTVQDYGSFPESYDLSPAQLIDSAVPLGDDQNTDLLLVRGGVTPTDPNDPALIVSEYGSTQRSLTAPYILTYNFDPSMQGSTAFATQATAASAGRFGPNHTAGLFALFIPQSTQNETTLVAGAPVALTETSYGDFTPSVNPQPVSPCSLCDAKAEIVTIKRDAGDVALGIHEAVGTPDDCMDYYIADSSLLPTLNPIACADLAPAAATATDAPTQAAYAALMGSTMRIIDNDGTTAHVVLSANSGPHTQHSYGWTLTIQNNQPQLASPISYDTELDAQLPSGSTAYCAQTSRIEAGSRTRDGTTYGASTAELLLTCSIATGAPATSFDTQLWVRYADPAGGPPLYELLQDLGADLSDGIRTGDLNGDGLDDVVYRYGEIDTGKGTMHVLLQCDAHQTGCTGGGS